MAGSLRLTKPMTEVIQMTNTNGKKHVLLLYKKMIPSVLLCGYYQLKWLEEQGRVEFRHARTLNVSVQDVNWADIVVMCRLDDPAERALARRLRRSGKKLVYAIDDDLLNVPPEMTSAPHYAMKSIRSAIASLMEMSDAIMSPSPVLLGKYGQPHGQTLLVEEPAMQPVPAGRARPEGPVRIGFVGSVDRAGDVEKILKGTLIRLKKEYGDRVQFVFFGAVPDFAGEIGAECVAYCNSYDEYRRTLDGLHLDVGLAPMPDSPFHACKHYNKFIEYAAAGLVGVFSDVMPYSRLREQFGWDLLCGNAPEDWHALLARLIEQPELIEAKRRELAALTEGPLSLTASAEHIGDFLDTMTPGEGRPVGSVWMAALRVRMIGGIGVRFFLRHGAKAPKRALQKLAALIRR